MFQVLQAIQFGEGDFSVKSLLYWPVMRPDNLAASAGRAWLPALEMLAGLFNQAVVSYPTSALAALLFLVNWRGYQIQLLRAAKGRLGRWWLAVYLALVFVRLCGILQADLFAFDLLAEQIFRRLSAAKGRGGHRLAILSVRVLVWLGDPNSTGGADLRLDPRSEFRAGADIRIRSQTRGICGQVGRRRFAGELSSDPPAIANQLLLDHAAD